MAAAYHSGESCEKDYEAFIRKVNPWFQTNNRHSIVSQFEKCIMDRKSDPLYVTAKAKPMSKLTSEDYSHRSVINMFEGLLDQIKDIREDRLSKYKLVLISTSKGNATIRLNTPVDDADKKVHVPKVPQGKEATPAKWAADEAAAEAKQAADEAAAKAKQAADEAAAEAKVERDKDERYRIALKEYNIACEAWKKNRKSIIERNNKRLKKGLPASEVIPDPPVKPVREGGRRRTRRKNGRHRTQKKRKTYV